MRWLPDEIMLDILERLPAKSFAAAACVDKTWNRLACQILSRPKLVSALSFNPSLINAVNEVLDKVLSKPIRPHFAIAFISEEYGLRLTHILLNGRLKNKVPLVVHISHGVIGKDVLSDELREAQWDYFDYRGNHPRECNVYGNTNKGFVLVLGSVPGLKVDAIPLFHPHADPDVDKVDKFLADIRAFSAEASGHGSPSAIMMFGDRRSDMKSVVTVMDHALAKESVIIGDAGGCFMFTSMNFKITSPNYVSDAVALVFAKDKDKSPDVGEIEFHAVMGEGLMPFGPKFEMLHVGVHPTQDRQTIFCATLEGTNILLSSAPLFHSLPRIVHDPNFEVFIGATQIRGQEESLNFYRLRRGKGYIFVVDWIGLQPGDSFMFNHTDMEVALTGRDMVWEEMEDLRERSRGQVFGGLVFCSNFRGRKYYGEENVDVAAFSDHFPEVPIAGAFCDGEIGRGYISLIVDSEDEEEEEGEEGDCSVHAFSTAYLAMSYVPARSC